MKKIKISEPIAQSLISLERPNNKEWREVLNQAKLQIETDGYCLIQAGSTDRFWDGAAYHRGEIMQKFLAEINQDLDVDKWQVTCQLLAPYAPEENPIEAVWLQLKSLLRRCYRFCKNFSIIKRLFEMLVDYKLFRFPNLKNYDTFSYLI